MRALFLRDHGRKPGDKMFFNHEVAYKYKMSSMQAALGLAQLERVDELLARKRQIFSWYQKRLSDVAGVRLNQGRPDADNVYWMITAIVDKTYGLKKEELMQLMSEHNIDCRPFFFPLSAIPAYQETEQAQLARARNEVTYRVTPFGINLPSGLNLTESDVAYVCQTLSTVLAERAAHSTMATA